jgi:hypothetical protein
MPLVSLGLKPVLNMTDGVQPSTLRMYAFGIGSTLLEENLILLSFFNPQWNMIKKSLGRKAVA